MYIPQASNLCACRLVVCVLVGLGSFDCLFQTILFKGSPMYSLAPSCPSSVSSASSSSYFWAFINPPGPQTPGGSTAKLCPRTRPCRSRAPESTIARNTTEVAPRGCTAGALDRFSQAKWRLFHCLPSTPLVILEPRRPPLDALGLSKSKNSAPWGLQSRLRLRPSGPSAPGLRE
jgi:hypothetical protein